MTIKDDIAIVREHLLHAPFSLAVEDALDSIEAMLTPSADRQAAIYTAISASAFLREMAKANFRDKVLRDIVDKADKDICEALSTPSPMVSTDGHEDLANLNALQHLFDKIPRSTCNLTAVYAPDIAEKTTTHEISKNSMSEGKDEMNEGPDGMLAYHLAMINPNKDDPSWPLPSFKAADWAEAFCKRFSDVPIDDAIGWFANALMRGYDEHARTAISEPVPVQVIDGLKDLIIEACGFYGAIDANKIADRVCRELQKKGGV